MNTDDEIRYPHELIFSLEDLNIILEARKCVEFLMKHGYLHKYELYANDLKEQILKDIDNKCKADGIFVKKPFRTYDSIGESLYNFMKSLQRDVWKLGMKDEAK